MAAENPSQLIQALKKAAATLQLAARWERGAVFTAKDDFVFELYVLVRFLVAAKASYRIQYIPGSGQTRHTFPRKPANKKGRPRFRLTRRTNASEAFQVCAGTVVLDQHGKERAPDLSVQRAEATDEPAARDLLMMWDAKFHGDASSRISGDDFSTFARWVELFHLRGAPVPNIDLGALAPMLGNTLVTNASFSTEPASELRRVSVREAEAFWPGRQHRVRPEEPAKTDDSLGADGEPPSRWAPRRVVEI